eukprot:5336086-Pleurochrysis_carterae.AAC.1
MLSTRPVEWPKKELSSVTIGGTWSSGTSTGTTKPMLGPLQLGVRCEAVVNGRLGAGVNAHAQLE